LSFARLSNLRSFEFRRFATKKPDQCDEIENWTSRKRATIPYHGGSQILATGQTKHRPQSGPSFAASKNRGRHVLRSFAGHTRQDCASLKREPVKLAAECGGFIRRALETWFGLSARSVCLSF
ncbi:unnamed protein product, partial [Ectocarpus sp. 12 AP-2014]